MALKEKSAVLQIRLDPDLLIRFQAYCEDRDRPVSMVIREMMRNVVDQYEAAQARKQKVATPLAVPVPSQVNSLDDDLDDDDDPVSPEPLNRAQRRAAEREKRAWAAIDAAEEKKRSKRR